MARMNGVEPKRAGWLTRLLFWLTRRSMRQLTGQDSLPEAATIVAHHPKLFRAVGRMEMAQAGAQTVEHRIKVLAGLRVSTLVGCPF